MDKLMDMWSRWRVDRADPNAGWPQVNLLGRMIRDMPSTRCSVCRGGADKGCPVCGGSGRVRADVRGVRINPALVRSTTPGSAIPAFYRVETHPLFGCINWIVSEILTTPLQAVVFHEYIFPRCSRNHTIKALKTTHQRYRQLLREALQVLQSNLSTCNPS